MWWRAQKPLIMGVVNVTPDSFSDGGDFLDPAAAITHGLQLVADGADILDIGGESTRPGAQAVDAETEWQRIGPVIAGLRDCGVPLSIDTRHAVTMRRAVDAGAGMLNDVTALGGDTDSMAAVRDCNLPICLMHMQGQPRTMQDNPHYDDVVTEVCDYLRRRVDDCVAAGIDRARIIIDAGIGFGKTTDHNVALLQAIPQMKMIAPVLIGVSRKRFIGALTGENDAARRDFGTVAASLYAIDAGAQIVRVHNVAAMRQALTVHQALRGTA